MQRGGDKTAWLGLCRLGVQRAPSLTGHGVRKDFQGEMTISSTLAQQTEGRQERGRSVGQPKGSADVCDPQPRAIWAPGDAWQRQVSVLVVMTGD